MNTKDPGRRHRARRSRKLISMSIHSVIPAILAAASVVVLTDGIIALDCNRNGIDDLEDIAARSSVDCDQNSVPDECDLEAGTAADCDGDGLLDVCELESVIDLEGGRRIEVSAESFTPLRGDYDGNDRADILAVSRDGRWARVLYSTADGSFAFGPTNVLEARPEAQAQGDIDGDGRSDLVIAVEKAIDASRWEIVVYSGRADGAFERGAATEVLPEAHFRLAVADLDRDGRSDVVYSTESRDEATVLWTADDGSLEGATTVLASGSRPVTVHIADVDDDIWPDLLVANIGSSTLSLYRGGEGRTFAPAESIALAPRSWPSAIAVADLDGDGRRDIIFDDGELDEVTVLLALVGGGFGEPKRNPSLAGLRTFDVRDIDGDEFLDVLIKEFDTPRASILWGIGDGTFERADIAVGAYGNRALIEDLDLDGRFDFVVHERGDLIVVRGLGGRRFAVPPRIDSRDGPVRPVVGDIDGDGALDVAVSAAGGSSVHVLWGLGNGELGRGPRATTDRFPVDVVVIDLDGDRLLDIVAVSIAESSVSIVRHTAPRSFGARETYNLSAGGLGVRAAHVDSDPHMDLVVVTRGPIHILRGRGDGTFEEAASIEVSASPTCCGALAVVDIDGDSFADIAYGVSLPDGAHVALRDGSGDGSFGGESFIPTGGREIRDLDVVDLNGDALLDIVVAHETSMDVTVLLGDETGGFRTGERYETREGMHAVVVADIDLDGVRDLAFRFRASIGVRRGLGDGRFGAEHRFAAAGSAGGIAAGDFDGDGDDDLAVSGDESVAVHRNLSGRRSAEDCDASGVPDECELASGVLVDLNENGRPDACENDCDLNGVPDEEDLATGELEDCDLNGIPDLCDTAGGGADDVNDNGVPDTCEVKSCRVPGDCTQNGRLELADAVCIFGTLFLGNPGEFPCGNGDASSAPNLRLLDWQADGRIDISDGVAVLGFLFLGQGSHALSVPGEERTGCVVVFGCP
jgi:hypothetical protein